VGELDCLRRRRLQEVVESLLHLLPLSLEPRA
jgi:hypothetical protein